MSEKEKRGEAKAKKRGECGRGRDERRRRRRQKRCLATGELSGKSWPRERHGNNAYKHLNTKQEQVYCRGFHRHLMRRGRHAHKHLPETELVRGCCSFKVIWKKRFLLCLEAASVSSGY